MLCCMAKGHGRVREYFVEVTELYLGRRRMRTESAMNCALSFTVSLKNAIPMKRMEPIEVKITRLVEKETKWY